MLGISPFETLFPLSFPTGYHEGKFFELFPTFRTYEASSFTFFKLSFESVWEVSVDFFQTGPHLYFTPTLFEIYSLNGLKDHL